MKIMRLLLVVILYNNCLYNMELSTSYKYGKTKIKVKKGSPCDVDGKAKIIVEGINEQRLCAKKTDGDNYLVGLTHIFYRKSMIIEVIEPLVRISEYDGEHSYYVEKYYKENEYAAGAKYIGDKALEKACGDLALCYNNVLTIGLEKLSDKKKKSIAFPALGVAVNFPREKAALTAISTVLDFIEKKPKAYSRIDFFAKDSSEFELYDMGLKLHLKKRKQKDCKV